MSAPLDVDMLQRSCDITDRVMGGVQPAQLGGPTPCRDWSVRELMEHMVSSTDFFADAAEQGAVAEDRDWPSHSPEELLPAYRRHARRLVAAFRAQGVMDRPMVILAGPPTAAFCIQVAISERFVHAWDLAAATGQPFEDGADIAEALLASPEYLSVNSEVRSNTPPPLGPELAVESGAGPVERLVAFLGRDPRSFAITPIRASPRPFAQRAP